MAKSIKLALGAIPMSVLTVLDRLTESVAAVCPIDGVSIGEAGVSSSVRIDFAAAATGPQRTAAQAVVDAFDWSLSAQSAWEDTKAPDRTALRAQAIQAIADNAAYLAIPTPTTAQAVGQVRKLTQQMNKVIPFLATLD